MLFAQIWSAAALTPLWIANECLKRCPHGRGLTFILILPLLIRAYFGGESCRISSTIVKVDFLAQDRNVVRRKFLASHFGVRGLVTDFLTRARHRIAEQSGDKSPHCKKLPAPGIYRRPNLRLLEKSVWIILSETGESGKTLLREEAR